MKNNNNNNITQSIILIAKFKFIKLEFAAATLFTNEKLNKMLNFLHFNILDKMLFSSYSYKRILFKLLQKAQAKF